MKELHPAKPEKRRILKRLLILLTACIIILSVAVWGWYRHKYPYGYRHVCCKVLSGELQVYAQDHDGWFPHGGLTPEASLAMLGKEPWCARLLAGKNLRFEAVAAALTNGTFGPDTCGWHYVEGLRQDDDPSIAIVWDKPVGLGHWADRNPYLMHEVIYVDGSTRYVSKSEWPGFVEDQRRRIAATIASRRPGAPAIRWSDEATLGPNQFAPQTVIWTSPPAPTQ